MLAEVITTLGSVPIADYATPSTAELPEAVSKYVLVDMFAKACTGTMKPAEAVKWAAKEYEQIARKRRT